MNKIEVNVNSEIGELEAVILHQPGPEIENMIPRNVERALYSDILNLSVALDEYTQFSGVLEKSTKVFYVKDLLKDILSNSKVKENLLKSICKAENSDNVCQVLHELQPEDLTRLLIEGVVMKKDTLTKFLDHNRYSLRPLHNFFFMRDSSVSMQNNVLISRMASKVRMREATIMESIFNYHPLFSAQSVDSSNSIPETPMSFEGGDLIVLRDDILVIGLSQRTNSQGIDFIIDKFKKNKESIHIIIQELPDSPESFIHLDMVFTCIDTNKYLVYKPLILDANHYYTIHITIDNGEVKSIEEKNNILDILKELKLDAEPVLCGGENDSYIQEREQWHSGANFFALAPGKIIGYKRNIYTIEALNKAGFEVIEANEIIAGTKSIDDYTKCVVVFEGSELARGGGGARCMTMPVRRKDVVW